MEADLQKEAAENESLPEGMEQIVQTFITTIREMMASTSDKEVEFWSKLKQMEVEFWKIKNIVADTSGQLKERISAMFTVVQEVDLNNIGTEDLVETSDEPRGS